MTALVPQISAMDSIRLIQSDIVPTSPCPPELIVRRSLFLFLHINCQLGKFSRLSRSTSFDEHGRSCRVMHYEKETR